VLIDRNYDLYDFVPEYEKWVSWSRDPARCGHPRLTKTEIKDCQESIAYAEFFRIKGPANIDAKPDLEIASMNAITGIPADANGIPADAEPASRGMPILHPAGCRIPEIGIPADANGIPRDAGPIDDRARALREIENLKLRAERERARVRMIGRKERWSLAEMKREESRINREFDLPHATAVLKEDDRQKEEREQIRRNST
jgi:hypothetical protein